MPAPYLIKPATPQWQRGSPLAAGVRAMYPFSEAGYLIDVASSYNGSTTGSLTWSSGPYGFQLSGFSTTNYAPIDPLAFSGFGTTFPFWCVTLGSNTGTTAGYTFSAGNTASIQPIVGLVYNFNSVTNRLAFFTRDAGTGGTNGTGLTFNTTQVSDGNPHVFMGVQWSATTASLYWDGVQAATWTAGTAYSPPTFNLTTCGVLRRSTITSPFTGNLMVVAAGSNSVPDPRKLADDWLSGQFSALRPKRQLAIFGAMSGATTIGPSAFPDGLVAGSPSPYVF